MLWRGAAAAHSCLPVSLCCASRGWVCVCACVRTRQPKATNKSAFWRALWCGSPGQEHASCGQHSGTQAWARTRGTGTCTAGAPCCGQGGDAIVHIPQVVQQHSGCCHGLCVGRELVCKLRGEPGRGCRVKAQTPGKHKHLAPLACGPACVFWGGGGKDCVCAGAHVHLCACVCDATKPSKLKGRVAAMHSAELSHLAALSARGNGYKQH